MVAAVLSNPILNSPYAPPDQHFEIETGIGPTGRILEGRRPSESFIPVAPQRKGRRAAEQVALDLDGTGDRRVDGMARLAAAGRLRPTLGNSIQYVRYLDDFCRRHWKRVD